MYVGAYIALLTSPIIACAKERKIFYLNCQRALQHLLRYSFIIASTAMRVNLFFNLSSNSKLLFFVAMCLL